MAEVVYICSEKQHNKFWSYEVKPNNHVTVKYGRVGEPGKTEEYDFGSASEAQNFIDKKVREKTGPRKGYKLASKDKLAEESDIAQTIGTRNKIKRTEWVSKRGDDLRLIDNYDPKQYVYVEVLNSWTKEMTRLLLSKTQTWIIQGGVTEADRVISMNTLREVSGSHPFSEGVRKLLKKMAEVVAEALKTVKFGAMGARSLFDDEGTAAPEVATALAAIDTSGFESGVINKFAAMGSRALEL